MTDLKLDYFNYIKKNDDESILSISYNKKNNECMGFVSGDFENIISLIVNNTDLPESKLIQSIILSTAFHLVLQNKYYYDIMKEMFNGIKEIPTQNLSIKK